MNEHNERLRRWRLLLGGGSADGIGYHLDTRDNQLDKTLSALYGSGKGEGLLGKSNKRGAGLDDSKPQVSRWLGDIREYFPASVVQVMQKDAIEHIGLHSLLTEPEILESLEADVDLVATLISLKHLIPEKTRSTARIIVQKVVDELMKKLRNPMLQAVNGSLNRSVRNYHPRYKEINWGQTIQANLKHYQPDYKTIIPEQLIGYGHKRSALREVIICIDQSGSMASSVVYASIFGAVMASIPALKTHLVVFDASIVDLTNEIDDPVDILFGVQLGGGTNINQAVAYCQQLVTRPSDTILILISDLIEGGVRSELLQRVRYLVNSGVQFVALLALSDDGRPSYDHEIAGELNEMNVPAFACTPDLFPDLMSSVVHRQDLSMWAARNDIQTS